MFTTQVCATAAKKSRLREEEVQDSTLHEPASETSAVSKAAPAAIRGLKEQL